MNTYGITPLARSRQQQDDKALFYFIHFSLFFPLISVTQQFSQHPWQPSPAWPACVAAVGKKLLWSDEVVVNSSRLFPLHSAALERSIQKLPSRVSKGLFERIWHVGVLGSSQELCVYSFHLLQEAPRGSGSWGDKAVRRQTCHHIYGGLLLHAVNVAYLNPFLTYILNDTYYYHSSWNLKLNNFHVIFATYLGKIVDAALCQSHNLLNKTWNHSLALFRIVFFCG